MPRSGVVTAGRDVVLEVSRSAATTEAAVAPPGADTVYSQPVVISNATGLHARPAAIIAARARQFKSSVRLVRGDRHANAKSLTSLMALEVADGDTVTIGATGEDASQAVAVLSRVVAEEARDSAPADAADRAAVAAPSGATVAPPRSADPNRLTGVAAAPGVALGKIFQWRQQEAPVVQHAADQSRERRQLDQALAEAHSQLDALQQRLATHADADKAAIFSAHKELLEDPDLLDSAVDAIQGGASAAYAWQQAYRAQADRLGRLSNELLAGRAGDVRDVGRRVLRILTGTASAPPELPADAIVIAEDLTPSDTASLDRRRVRGLCTTGGGSTSHAAILARALDLPAVVGIDPRALEVHDGTPAMIDGSRGILQIEPSDDERASVVARQGRLETLRAAERAAAQEPAATTDGHRVEVVANIGDLAEARQVVPLGGEGVGLLRTEFLFFNRQEPPGEDEQARIYEDIVRAVGPGRILVVRTLDVGGDKPLPYLPMAAEENPFLGERGIRMLLNRPDVLRTQLRAIVRASAAGRICVMFPMIATMEEWSTARGFCEAALDGARRLPYPGRDHGRDTGGRAARGSVRPRCRLLLDRHQRPHSVHPGDGPHASAAGARARCAPPGGVATDRADRQGRARAAAVGRRLRQPRQRSASGPDPDRAGRRRTQRQRSSGTRGQGADSPPAPVGLPGSRGARAGGVSRLRGACARE